MTAPISNQGVEAIFEDAYKVVLFEQATYSDRIVSVTGYTPQSGRGPIGLYYRVSFTDLDGEATDEGFGGCLGGFTSQGDAIHQARACILKNAPADRRNEFFPFWGKSRPQS